MTHTYAELEVSRATYDEIAQKLRAAGYQHVFINAGPPDAATPTIDMHGIGLILEGTTMAAENTDAPLTDDMTIEIDVQLLQDKHNPKAEALAFERAGASVDISDGVSGAWTTKREFRCRFTVGDLRRLARSITPKKEKADVGSDTPAGPD